jgi:phosphatidate phosphatase APP1
MWRRAFVGSVACAVAWVLAAERAHGRDVEAAWLEIYTAYGTPTGGTILGRAHEGPPPAPTPPGPFEAIRELRRALDVEALPLTRVSIRVADREWIVATDSHGYFEVALTPGLPAPTAHVEVRLVDPRWRAAPLRGEVPVFGDAQGLALLSDVDDTLLDTHARHKLHLLAHILSHPSSELLAFHGAAATLTALAGAGADARPLVYVSGSPTSFRRRIGDWLARAGFPSGPLILKRFSSEPIRDQMAYKWPHVIALVDALPSRQWILFGDSGESDPEIYRRLMLERPGRVRMVYIHVVTGEAADAPRFSGMIPFREWAEAAADLEGRGLIIRPVDEPLSSRDAASGK